MDDCSILSYTNIYDLENRVLSAVLETLSSDSQNLGHTAVKRAASTKFPPKSAFSLHSHRIFTHC